MDSTTQVALYGLMSGLAVVGGPIFLSWLQGRQRKAEKEQDYARQDKLAAEVKSSADAVAIKVEDAAKLLIVSQNQASKAAEEVKNTLERSTTSTNVKLDVIHRLSNSALTSAFKNELAGLSREVIILYEMADLKKAQGIQANGRTEDAIAVANIRIEELKVVIKTREDEQKEIDKMVGSKS